MPLIIAGKKHRCHWRKKHSGRNSQPIKLDIPLHIPKQITKKFSDVDSDSSVEKRTLVEIHPNSET